MAPNDFSISAYVYLDETIDGWQTIVEYNRGLDLGKQTSWFGMWVSPEGKAHFRVGHGSQDSEYDWTSTLNSNKTLQTGQWYLITATYDADTDQAIIYMGKDQEASDTLSITSFWSAPSVGDLTIGASKSRSEINEHFNGLIDEVKIWNETLSADDVEKLSARKKRSSNCPAEETPTPESAPPKNDLPPSDLVRCQAESYKTVDIPCLQNLKIQDRSAYFKTLDVLCSTGFIEAEQLFDNCMANCTTLDCNRGCRANFGDPQLRLYEQLCADWLI